MSEKCLTKNQGRMVTPGSYTYFRKREFYQFVYYSEFEVELVMTKISFLLRERLSST